MAKKTRQRRSFSPEFRAKVVSRIKAGEPIHAVARELTLHDNSIIGWLRTDAKRNGTGTIRRRAPQAARRHVERPMDTSDAIIAAFDAEIARRQAQIDALLAAKELLTKGG